MKVVFVLLVHLVVTFAKLLGPGGIRAVIAETMAVKHQLLITNRSRQRAPNLTATDRALFGIWSLLIRPHRLPKVAVVWPDGPVTRTKMTASNTHHESSLADIAQ